MEGANAVAASDGVAERFGGHIVQQDDVRAGGENRIKLIEPIDFDFDEHIGHVALGERSPPGKHERGGRRRRA